MQAIRESCDKADNYPLNLVCQNTYQHILSDYVSRLNAREKDLFMDKDACSVDFLQHSGEKGVHQTNIKTLSDLKAHLWKDVEETKSLPKCRFMFMTAPHSRERLKISRAMMSYAFSYHQVSAGFLDFVFQFGKTDFARNSQYSGFRHESSLGEHFQSLEVPELHRSGPQIRMCYSLKSVESSKANEEWPWSIRSLAVYHSFYVPSGQAEWIVVKGNQLMKTRVASLASSHRFTSTAAAHRTVEQYFTLNIEFHQLFADWSAEGWRWYIDYLEDKFQALTRHALAAAVEVPLAKVPSPLDIAPPSRYSSFSSASTLTSWKVDPCDYREKVQGSPGLMSGPSTLMPINEISHETPNFNNNTPGPSSGTDDFSFNDFQKIQDLGEKTSEALFVLKSNDAVLSEFAAYYRSIPNSRTFDGELAKRLSLLANPIHTMIDRISLTQKELRIQIERAKALRELLTNRKTLLYSILEYRNVQASRSLAEKAQTSTDNVEVLTREMHKIAQKTQQETVSMRIITLVTLFFLPGTFISTVMSTDIVHWDTNAEGRMVRVVSLEALWVYLASTLPLMVVTFAGWYGVHWWVNASGKEKLRAKIYPFARPKRLHRAGTA
ncbi:hypothetical protein BDV96DRAFT_598636 [Lophiotrema nucula]|uniref:CorA-like transporter domain-containing protein n=1 Tax=Lophiotrema nucula TaxID=690887 RepID=A0A6A5ZC11_9PLEO|nr:hypothetical protein BDV96DRAFT_598636 [Lophiotrema nucula]